MAGWPPVAMLWRQASDLFPVRLKSVQLLMPALKPPHPCRARMLPTPGAACLPTLLRRSVSGRRGMRTGLAPPGAPSPVGRLVADTAKGRLPAVPGPGLNCGEAALGAADCVGGPPSRHECVNVAQGGPGFTIMRSTSQAASEVAAHEAEAAEPSSVVCLRPRGILRCLRCDLLAWHLPPQSPCVLSCLDRLSCLAAGPRQADLCVGQL